jgi:hypothetical protein
MNKCKIDENDPNTYVVSKLNGKKYSRITHKHVKLFGLTLDEYKEKYDLSSNDLISKAVHDKLGFTVNKAIEKYGEEDGLKKWREYCEKQAITNTFEYKKQKYGMSKKDFDEYNAKRAVTLQNLIDRHGVEKGEEMWERYRQRQSYAGMSLEYFVEKYGEAEGSKVYKDVTQRRARTLENYILKYGEAEGKRRYTSSMEDRTIGYSLIAKNLFDIISSNFVGNKIYYMDLQNNKEFGVYDNINNRYYFYDYIDYTLKKGIEFNGDVFHGNPKTFNKYDTPNPIKKQLICEKIWEYDTIKIDTIKKIHNIDILTIWESDYNNNATEIVDKCIQFLKK